MATTTNYSWTTPDDTDLVKDGAAAIRTLGSAIDTTVFNNAGAAVAKSTIDAKGDLLVGTADNTVGRLAVGTNGQYLSANSSTSTGLEWVTLSAGGMTELATGSLSGTTTTISSISGSYKNLVIRLQDIVTNANGNVSIRFNGDTSTNYAYAHTNSKSGTTYASGTGDSLLTFIVTLNSTGTDASANITIFNYANSVAYKPITYSSIGLAPVSSPAITGFNGGGGWANTAAINSVSIIAESTNTLTGTYYIYGVN